MIDQLDELVTQAVARAFDTMLNVKVAAETSDATLWNGEPHVAGSVGFIGKLTGVVYIYSSATFAREITGQLLGLKIEEIEGEEMVNDAIGELTNMVVGQIKSQLSDRGMPCVLTIPSIVRGSQFVVESMSSTTRRFNTFKCGNHRLGVETLIKPS
ncbi:MAG: chemotaxis protein CheX [Verrucomicrobiales bacterium]|nr:chemotaxis protein CheX [Verrucomicrobiales bacterium]